MKLDDILQAHKLWLDTESEEGTMADLREANLRRANLSEADLRWANLEGVKK